MTRGLFAFFMCGDAADTTSVSHSSWNRDQLYEERVCVLNSAVDSDRTKYYTFHKILLKFWLCHQGKTTSSDTSLSHTLAVALCVSVVCHVSISTPKQTKKNVVLKQFHPDFQVKTSSELFPILNLEHRSCSARDSVHLKWVSVIMSVFTVSLTVSSSQGRVRGRCVYARWEVKSRSPCILEKHAFVKPANNSERCPQ